jgi:hypothetical protein
VANNFQDDSFLTVMARRFRPNYESKNSQRRRMAPQDSFLSMVPRISRFGIGGRVSILLLQSCEQRADRASSGVASKLAHSEPTRAPFSATERFMNNTANATANVNAATIQKVSK